MGIIKKIEDGAMTDIVGSNFYGQMVIKGNTLAIDLT